MFGFKKKTVLPAPETALPGRETPIPTADRHFVNDRPLAGPYPEGSELATLGMGCFWGVERMFWTRPGVWVTMVGYAGGVTPNPTYQEVCSGLTGHTEVVRVVYEPSRIGYADLLRVFWENHDPTQGMRQGNDVGTQYRSAIYVHSPEQERLAQETREVFQGRLSGAGVLLRRGLSPAVPRQEPRRLLRRRRDWRDLPDWCRRIGAGLPFRKALAADASLP